MQNNKYLISGEQLKYSNTNHFSGLKKIMIANGANHVMPQVAIGLLDANDTIEAHKHQDMDEYFFILNGECKFTIDDVSFNVRTDDLINVPFGSIHSLSTEESNIRFIYWGIVENKNEK